MNGLFLSQQTKKKWVFLNPAFILFDLHVLKNVRHLVSKARSKVDCYMLMIAVILSISGIGKCPILGLLDITL